MISLRQIFTAGAVAVAMAATSVSAATVTTQNDGRLLVLNADSVMLPSGASWVTTPPATVSGSVVGQYRSPFENGPGTFANGTDQATQYFNILGGTSATLKTSLSAVLSFLWGSVDTYNTLTLRNSTDSSILTVLLADLYIPDIAVQSLSASLVKISGFTFDSVEFVSRDNSFEFSNITATPAAVPLPAGALLLLTGLGGIAALRRLKRPA